MKPRKLPSLEGKNGGGADYLVGRCKPPVQHQIKPGQALNPNGRPKGAGYSIKEHLNAMQDWPIDKVKAVLEDSSAPAAKVAAARLWMHACSQDFNSAGSPIAGPEFDRVMDRTIGKPTASVDLTSGGESIYKVLKGVSQDDL